MGFLLWVLSVILVVFGVADLLQGQVILGLLLIIVGLGIGPGGFSFYHGRRV